MANLVWVRPRSAWKIGSASICTPSSLPPEIRVKIELNSMLAMRHLSLLMLKQYILAKMDSFPLQLLRRLLGTKEFFFQYAAGEKQLVLELHKHWGT